MNDSERTSITEDEDNEFSPPRRRVSPAAITGIIALVVLIVAGGIFATTRLVGGSANATPTPTLVPGSNLFYIQTSPGWGTVFVDGQKLAHVPGSTPNDLPLQLSVGVHQVAWQADLFTQKCTIIVPPVLSETKCLANDPVTVTKGPHKGLPAFLIDFTASFSDLAPAQQQSLISAARQALNALQSSEIVQPGEQYADLNAPSATATATSALRATLHFQLITDPNSPAQCMGGFLDFGECRYNGQDCHLFCTVSNNLPLVPQPGRWDVFGIMQASWTYTTLNGQVVAQNQPDEADNNNFAYQVNLSITHTGDQWHVVTSVPATTSTFLNGPSCVAAYNTVTQSASGMYTSANLPGNPNQSLTWSTANGSNLAAGCLLTAYPQAKGVVTAPTPQPKPVALCLYRFGVLLALDNGAHSFWPNLPLADAYEKGIAQRIPV